MNFLLDWGWIRFEFYKGRRIPANYYNFVMERAILRAPADTSKERATLHVVSNSLGEGLFRTTNSTMERATLKTSMNSARERSILLDGTVLHFGTTPDRTDIANSELQSL